MTEYWISDLNDFTISLHCFCTSPANHFRLLHIFLQQCLLYIFMKFQSAGSRLWKALSKTARTSYRSFVININLWEDHCVHVHVHVHVLLTQSRALIELFLNIYCTWKVFPFLNYEFEWNREQRVVEEAAMEIREMVMVKSLDNISVYIW